MATSTYNILFLSQRAAARSVIAEALANSIGRGRFRAYSAGVRPTGGLDPLALELLGHVGLAAPDHPPWNVKEFNAPDAPQLDFVFTLSDTAAGEAPPSWPGRPVTGHWRCTDPMQFDDPTERRLALLRTRKELERRLRLLASLPLQSLDKISLQTHVESIGRETE